MKKILIALMICVSVTTFAHDEGHGPKISDGGKYGGLVSAVVMKSDASMGARAALVYKAELVRSADGNLRVYLYDHDMKPIDMTTFESKATAVLAAKIKGKWTDTKFGLEFKDNFFIGKMPKIQKKPYNIDITIKQKGKELITAFDNLD